MVLELLLVVLDLKETELSNEMENGKTENIKHKLTVIEAKNGDASRKMEVWVRSGEKVSMAAVVQAETDLLLDLRVKKGLVGSGMQARVSMLR